MSRKICLLFYVTCNWISKLLVVLLQVFTHTKTCTRFFMEKTKQLQDLHEQNTTACFK